MRSVLLELLITLKRRGTWNEDGSKERLTQEHDLFVKFIKLVEVRYKEWHEVKTYLESLDTNYYRLMQCVHAYANTTPLKIIEHRLIEESKRILSVSELQAKEIATLLGYNDSSYFVRSFKKIVGISPTSYRTMVNKSRR